jgi:hypothetical protein
MSGDHRSLPLRAFGHVMRASMTPQTTTNRNKAIRNCTALSQHGFAGQGRVSDEGYYH